MNIIYVYNNYKTSYIALHTFYVVLCVVLYFIENQCEKLLFNFLVSFFLDFNFIKFKYDVANYFYI